MGGSVEEEVLDMIEREADGSDSLEVCRERGGDVLWKIRG